MTAPTKEEKRAETKLEGDMQRVVSKEGAQDVKCVETDVVGGLELG